RKIDVVVLDMVMPEISGKDAYIQMNEIDPHVKVLLASGFKQDERVSNVISLGVNGFIQKPYTLEKLINAIQKIS
ncbi:MAG: response regulator, partial [bacterium]|nr:response regulator [bacterium]